MARSRRPSIGSALVLVVAAVVAATAISVAEDRHGPAGPAALDLRDASAKGQVDAKSPPKVVVKKKRGKRGPEGPRGPQGPAGPQGVQGPAGAAGTDAVRDLSVNWNDSSTAAGNDSASVGVPSIGTLTVTCPGPQGSPKRLILTAADQSAAVRTLMTLTTYQGSGSSASSLSRYPITGAPWTAIADIPNNAMISGTLSVEPVNGNGATPGVTPATIVVSSYWKDNDPTPSQNYCHVSAQVILGG